jgi:hypothetical protein
MNEDDRLLMKLRRAVLVCMSGVIGLGIVLGAIVVRLTAAGDAALRTAGLSVIATIAFGVACAVPTILAIEIAIRGVVRQQVHGRSADRSEKRASDVVVRILVEINAPGGTTVVTQVKGPQTEVIGEVATQQRISTSLPSRLLNRLRLRSKARSDPSP